MFPFKEVMEEVIQHNPERCITCMIRSMASDELAYVEITDEMLLLNWSARNDLEFFLKFVETICQLGLFE